MPRACAPRAAVPSAPAGPCPPTPREKSGPLQPLVCVPEKHSTRFCRKSLTHTESSAHSVGFIRGLPLGGPPTQGHQCVSGGSLACGWLQVATTSWTSHLTACSLQALGLLSSGGPWGAEDSGGTVSLAPCALAGLTLGPGCHPLDLVSSEPLQRGSISQPLMSEVPSFVYALLYLLWFL